MDCGGEAVSTLDTPKLDIPGEVPVDSGDRSAVSAYSGRELGERGRLSQMLCGKAVLEAAAEASVRPVGAQSLRCVSKAYRCSFHAVCPLPKDSL